MPHPRPLVWPILLLGSLPIAAASAQPDEDDFEGQKPGLRAVYTTADAPRARISRIEPAPRHDWGTAAPDPRLPADRFEAVWSGTLLIQAPGAYRFRVASDGDVQFRLDGQPVAPDAPVELRLGFRPLTIRYRHQDGPASVAVDWEGPGFANEPLPARVLFHAPEAGDSPDAFAAGLALADRLGCVNCHATLDLPAHPALGPPLDRAGREIGSGWLADWLGDPHATRPGTSMPGFGDPLPASEVADMAAFLREVAGPPAQASAEIRMALNLADPDRGRVVFHAAGCLGCHPGLDAGPRPGPAPAPDLSGLGRKRTRGWVATYLARPRPNQPGRHRPDLRILAEDASHLAAYLVPAGAGPTEPAAPDGDPDGGRKLAESYRCAACHAIPGLDPVRPARPLGAGLDPEGGCLADTPAPGLPRFGLDGEARKALRAFVAGLPGEPSPLAEETLAELGIARRGCLGCHARDGSGGERLGRAVAAQLGRDPALNALKGTLTPPNLSSVGDKLRPEFLAAAVRGEAPTSRPWLSVRMPVFAYEPGEADRIVAHLRSRDRSSRDEPEAPEPSEVDAATFDRAATLIGQRGFGCISCHVLDGKVPPGGEPETLGPDLALVHRRMDQRYFRRWIANPQRIIPGTPMPQFLQPIAGVPGTLDDQLDDLWAVLGSPKVAEVARLGTRSVLRHDGKRPLVVRDMVLVPGLPGGPHTPRGLAIGLKNGQSLLFDTDRLGWLAAWREGFLYRTKSGRLWEWHPDGPLSRVAPTRVPPVAFLDPDGRTVEPRAVRERFGSFRALRFEGEAIALEYTLLGPESATVTVRETIEPTADGWDRLIRVEGLPDGYRALAVEPVGPSAQLSDDRSALSWTVDGRRLAIKATGPALAIGPAIGWPMTHAADGSGSIRLRFRDRPGP